MEANKLIDIICPEHSRTSCSDDDISNGFYILENSIISMQYPPRCSRCALLEINNGRVILNKENLNILSDLKTSNYI